jgi:hypothetical protein
MPESTSEQRSNWAAYECRKDKMTSIPFGPDRILVAPPTVDAWQLEPFGRPNPAMQRGSDNRFARRCKCP